MGLNKPISVSGGLTAADVQTIIDAQTTAITGKVDEQTNTLKTDLPSSISGGASISDINAALDEKLPQYQSGVVKSKQICYYPSADLTNSIISGGFGAKLNDAICIYQSIIDSGIQNVVNQLAGYITLNPIDKSNSIIKSSQNDLYENRNFDSGLIERAYSFNYDNVNTYTVNGKQARVVTSLTVKEERIVAI